MKNLPVFCKWYNSIPFLFSVPKKYQYHLTEISVQMVSAPNSLSTAWNLESRKTVLDSLSWGETRAEFSVSVLTSYALKEKNFLFPMGIHF